MNRFLQFISIFIGCLVLINISFIEIDLNPQYYIVMGATFLILLLIKLKIKFNALMLWLIGSVIISVLFNDIPYFFKPFERLLIFITLLLLISPLIRTPILDVFRLNLFYWMNIFIILMVVASVIGLFTGIYTGKEDRRDFTGLFTHSMVLGPMSGIAILSTLYMGYISNRKLLKIGFFVLTAISFIGNVLAASRIALVASLFAIMFFFFKIYQGRVIKYIRIYAILVLLILISYPLWKKQSEFLWSKMEYSEAEGSLIATRESIWEDRLYEFNSSPIVGIGFASVDTSVSANFEKEGGKVEPGSSWLAVLSMIGLLGIIPIILLFYKYFKIIYRAKGDILILSFFGSLLVFMSVHMFAEGYIFSAGSGMFFFLWLLLGSIDITIDSIFKFGSKNK